MAGRGRARQGKARLGAVRRGLVRRGVLWHGRPGLAGLGEAPSGAVGQA